MMGMKTYKFRDGVNAVVYREMKNKREFLIMHRIKNWIGWEFPKGGSEPEETHKEALIRELGEECGIPEGSIISIQPTNTSLEFDYPKEMQKRTHYRGASYENFLVQINALAELVLERTAKPEHDAIKWVSCDAASRYLADPKLMKILAASIRLLSRTPHTTKPK
jgi:8-oxo-dGTP pyrophosphatase MutT (NUDIX family)